MTETRHTPPPTVRRWLLGVALRSHREQRGLTIIAVAASMRWSVSKQSRIEATFHWVDQHDVAALARHYSLSDTEIAALAALAVTSNKVEWWDSYRDVFSGPFIPFEQAASIIRAYEPNRIPGLLQTPGYARRIISAMRPGATEYEIERQVMGRGERRAIFDRADSPRFTALIGEHALSLCKAAGQELSREQFGALLIGAARSRVSVRVLLDKSGFRGTTEGFTVLGFPQGDAFRCVYVGGPDGGVFHDDRERVEPFDNAWRLLNDATLTEAETAEYLRAEIEDMK